MLLNVVYKAPCNLVPLHLPASFLTASFPYPLDAELTREKSWVHQCVLLVQTAPIHLNTSVPGNRRMPRAPFVYGISLGEWVKGS